MQLRKMLAAAALATLVAGTPALAQDQDQRPERGRQQRQRQPQLTPEKAEAAWTWEAKELAHSMKLETARAAQLTKSYVASRKALVKAREEARGRRGGEGGGIGDRSGRGQRGGEGGEAGDRRGRGQGQGGQAGRGGRGGPGGANNEMVEKERKVLASTLESILEPKQAQEAMKSLGSFSSQWDTMVDTVVGFELGETKTLAALAPIRTYIAKTTEARASGDMRAMREVMTDARAKMVADLGKVLDEEQVAKFQPRQRGQRGGRGFGGADRDRPEETLPEQTSAKAEIGKPAPAFTLKDAAGKAHALADYKGKIVVLQWINPDCPVCKAASSSGKIAAMTKELGTIAPGVVHLTVNSTNYMEPSVGAAYLKQHKIAAPALADRDGTVGHLYGAKTTPHMFVIDAKGVLRYQGAIDDDPSGRKGDGAMNYVVNAVRQIAAGETVAPDATKSYGCSVKYSK